MSKIDEERAELLKAKKFAIYKLLTGKDFVLCEDSMDVMQYGIYLLQRMGVELEYCDYGFIQNKGISSTKLRQEVENLDGYNLLLAAKERLLDKSSKRESEKVTALYFETRNSDGTEYSQTEYLGAMANAHYLDREVNIEKTLNILSLYTPFTDLTGNIRAYDSVRRLMHR